MKKKPSRDCENRSSRRWSVLIPLPDLRVQSATACPDRATQLPAEQLVISPAPHHGAGRSLQSRCGATGSASERVSLVVTDVTGGKRHSTDQSPISSINPAAADDDVAVVEDGGLSGRDRRLRVVELELGAAVVNGPHTASRRAMAMANL